MAMYADTVANATQASRPIDGWLCASTAIEILAHATTAKATDSDLVGQRTIHSSAPPSPPMTAATDSTKPTVPSGGAELHSMAKGMAASVPAVTATTVRVISAIRRP